MDETWRWFGPEDIVSIDDIAQAGANGIVTSLHHIRPGEVWTKNEIDKRHKEISIFKNGSASKRKWRVVESLPVSEEVKKQSGNWQCHIENYIKSMQNIAESGVFTICYNFMPILDWTRTDLSWRLSNGARCLRFDLIDFLIFDVYILKRSGAKSNYLNSQLKSAEKRLKKLSQVKIDQLTYNIIRGLPGSVENLSINDIKKQILSYSEISEKTAIRTRLNASRFTGSIIAGLTGLIIAGVVLGSEGSANNEYFLMGKISGCIAVAATLISCWGLAPFAKKARRPSGKVEAITLQFKRIFRNKKFLKVITLYILLWCALQLMQTVALIYVEDVLNVPTYIAKWIPIPFQISALVGLQIWTRVSNKLNRISALNYGAIMWIISCTAALFLPSLSKISGAGDSLFLNAGNIFLFILLIFIICLIGIGASTAFLIPWSLLPDAIDEDPEKPAGLYTAWMVLIQKIGIAFSVQLLGFLLYLSGYQACFVDEDSLNIIEQCYSAQLTIRLCIGFIPSVLVIIGLLIMRKWDRKLITN